MCSASDPSAQRQNSGLACLASIFRGILGASDKEGDFAPDPSTARAPNQFFFSPNPRHIKGLF